MSERSYRFAPHLAGGFLLGLRVAQLAGLVVFGALALALLRLGGLAGLVLALVLVALAAVLLLLPVRGQTLEQWVPLLVRFALAGITGRRRFVARRAQLGHVIALPRDGLEPQTPREPWALPGELAGLRFLQAQLAQYQGAAFGAVKDARTFTAVVRVRGGAFALLSPPEREQRLADYGAVLAALARDQSAVRRIAWIERTPPADGDALGNYLLAAGSGQLRLTQPSQELVSYLSLIDQAGDVAEEHELSFAIQIDAARPVAKRAIARLGGGDAGALAVLAGELGALIELLDRAGISVTGVLTRRGLAAAVRDAYDPWGQRERQRSVSSAEVEYGIAPHTAGPVLRQESIGHIASDGALHCTLWAAEWPRFDVRALFLQPLLMDSQVTRSIAMCMELVGPATAIRRAERAATETATEQHLRARVGQRTSQRQSQRDRAASQRERELAEGHAAVRYAAYATVSVPADTPDAIGQLEADVSRLSLEAKRAPLRLERLWGQQAEAFTYTLPLCRGLR